MLRRTFIGLGFGFLSVIGVRGQKQRGLIKPGVQIRRCTGRSVEVYWGEKIKQR